MCYVLILDQIAKFESICRDNFGTIRVLEGFDKLTQTYRWIRTDWQLEGRGRQAVRFSCLYILTVICTLASGRHGSLLVI